MRLKSFQFQSKKSTYLDGFFKKKVKIKKRKLRVKKQKKKKAFQNTFKQKFQIEIENFK
jgi:hypothetical protein